MNIWNPSEWTQEDIKTLNYWLLGFGIFGITAGIVSIIAAIIRTQLDIKANYPELLLKQAEGQ